MAHRLQTALGMRDIFGQLGTLQRALDYHAERHNVIASNVANANTPGFVPSELLRQKGPEAPRGTLPMVATHEGHMGVNWSNDPSMHHVVESPDGPGGLDRNQVSLERQMSKLAANDIRFQGAARLVSASLARLRYAASDGNA